MWESGFVLGTLRFSRKKIDTNSFLTQTEWLQIRFGRTKNQKKKREKEREKEGRKTGRGIE
jgi:hypothetical protein